MRMGYRMCLSMNHGNRMYIGRWCIDWGKKRTRQSSDIMHIRKPIQRMLSITKKHAITYNAIHKTITHTIRPLTHSSHLPSKAALQKRKVESQPQSWPNSQQKLPFQTKPPYSPHTHTHYSTLSLASFLPQTSSAPLFPFVSGTHHAINAPNPSAHAAKMK